MVLKAHKTRAKFSLLIVSLKGKLQTQLHCKLIFLFCLFFSLFVFLSSFLCRSPPPPFSEDLWPPRPLRHSRLFFPFVLAQDGLWEAGWCPARWIQLAFPTAWQAWRISTSLCFNPSVKLGCLEVQTVMLYVAYEARWFRMSASIKEAAGTWKLPQTWLLQV